MRNRWEENSMLEYNRGSAFRVYGRGKDEILEAKTGLEKQGLAEVEEQKTERVVSSFNLKLIITCGCRVVDTNYIQTMHSALA